MRLFLDVECYKNYFLVLFTNEQEQSKSFVIHDGDDSSFDRKAILKVLEDNEIVTFNGISYDLVMTMLAIKGLTTEALKRVSNQIIEQNKKHWHIYRDYGLREPININHIDLIEVAIGRVSLKLYGGRLHSRRLQDLPLPADAEIKKDQLKMMRKYCKNDTLLTRDLYNELREAIELRTVMSKEYGTDLRSKSDAQIAEAVLKTEYLRIVGVEPPKTNIKYKSFYYEPPKYIKFRSEPLRDVLNIVKSADMIIKDTGHVQMPKTIEKMKIKIGDTTYKLGLGGIHSQESEVAHYADEDTLLIDRDVASYYPNMMLNMGMSPGSFGEHFPTVYKNILDKRMEAKRNGVKAVSESLKIVLNGTFGKTSNKYSRLYAPKMMIRTTLTGQLSLLMLIEACEELGIPVVSANTDGIVMKCPRSKKAKLDKLVSAWEKRTKLSTEETTYKALYSRDVNSYIALMADGGVKTKGIFAKAGLNKNPQNEICTEAVINYLRDGKPCEETIRECDDIRKFLTVRTVTGGAKKDEKLLGKAIRWYYSTSTTTAIHYVKDNKTVARSDGAMPLMDLPDTFPEDVNYEWYEAECKDLLLAAGAVKRPVVEKIPRKNSKAWKALLEAGEIQENRKGKYEWVNPQQHLGASAA